MTLPDRESGDVVIEAPATFDPDTLRDLYAQLDKDSYLEACCHILKRAQGPSNASAAPWTLCGLVLRRPQHAMTGHPTCPTCRRPRCPECHARYGRGER